MFKILLVDDEKSILKSLAFALEQDYEVYTSDNGRDALELVREHDISLVLLDLRLGKENGIQLMKEILTVNPGARHYYHDSVLFHRKLGGGH
jgi:two-component system response regulator AtoC